MIARLVTTALLPFLLAASALEEPEKVGFGTLAGFDWKEGMELPKEVVKFHEKKVSISGYMRREDDGSGETEYFMLINDACGCQGTPKMNEIVFCTMPEDEPTEILPGIVTVTGKLWVGEEKQDGAVVALYVLDVEKISQQ
jgi:hypothetical protein